MSLQAQPKGLLVFGDNPQCAVLSMLVLEGTVWRSKSNTIQCICGIQRSTTMEKCADCQKTVAALIAASALCVYGGG